MDASTEAHVCMLPTALVGRIHWLRGCATAMRARFHVGVALCLASRVSQSNPPRGDGSGAEATHQRCAARPTRMAWQPRRAEGPWIAPATITLSAWVRSCQSSSF